MKVNYDNFLLILAGKNMFREIQRIRLQRSLHQCVGRDFEGISMLSEVLYPLHSCAMDPNLCWSLIPLFPRVTQKTTSGKPVGSDQDNFLSLPIFILSFDTRVSVRHIVTPLSKTAPGILPWRKCH